MPPLPHKLYLAQQSRELDRIAIEEHGIEGIELMRTAAKAVFDCIRQNWKNARHIAIFCGSGNNAGDGYFVASFAMQANFRVTVYSVGDSNKLTGDALIAYQDYKRHGGDTQPLQALTQRPNLIVDALLGTGLARNVSGHYADAVEIINQSKCPVVAVDIPSGINADTGRIMGCAVKADKTVSFIALKQGLFTADALEHCGDILFDDLNVPAEIFTKISHSSELVHPPALPCRKRNSHKGDFGHVLVIGGDAGMSGAARLAAEAALRIGAGLVSVATHPSHATLLNIGRFELMCHAIEGPEQLQPLLEKASVVVFGTGLGQKDWGNALFNALDAFAVPVVVDADGLNLLAQSPDYNEQRVLTPHPKEAAHLLGCSVAEIQSDRFQAAEKIQSQYGGVCLLKGAGTLIHDGQQSFVNTTGNPGMATAGMGDVLSGIIGGLLAQGMSLPEATKAGAYLHGRAADFAAKHGERGLLAGDLMSYIRKSVN